ncbi:acyltransferase family protein, partial [Escherichia coli]|uniref:acyltransferase family protein n=3 Tax=Enterobacterales TaxID=91347 RepID=UPI0040677EFD
TNSSEPLWVYWFIQFIPYYFSGYYLSKTPINIDLRVSLGFSLICALGIFIASYYMSITYDKTQYFYEPLSPLVIFMSLSVFVSLMKWESVFSNYLANLSLGVYLIHPFILLAFFKIFKSFALSQPLLGFISSWILCTIMSFALIYILKRIPFVRSCA